MATVSTPDTTHRITVRPAVPVSRLKAQLKRRISRYERRYEIPTSQMFDEVEGGADAGDGGDTEVDARLSRSGIARTGDPHGWQRFDRYRTVLEKRLEEHHAVDHSRPGVIGCLRDLDALLEWVHPVICIGFKSVQVI